MSRTHGHEAPDVFLGPTVGWGRDAPSSSRTISVPRCHDANADLTMTTVGLLQPPTRLTRIIHSFIHHLLRQLAATYKYTVKYSCTINYIYIQ